MCRVCRTIFFLYIQNTQTRKCSVLSVHTREQETEREMYQYIDTRARVEMENDRNGTGNTKWMCILALVIIQKIRSMQTCLYRQTTFSSKCSMTWCIDKDGKVSGREKGRATLKSRTLQPGSSSVGAYWKWMQTLKNRNNTNRRRNQDPRNILTIIDYGIETTQPEDSANKKKMRRRARKDERKDTNMMKNQKTKNKMANTKPLILSWMGCHIIYLVSSSMLNFLFEFYYDPIPSLSRSLPLSHTLSLSFSLCVYVFATICSGDALEWKTVLATANSTCVCRHKFMLSAHCTFSNWKLKRSEFK